MNNDDVKAEGQKETSESEFVKTARKVVKEELEKLKTQSQQLRQVRR